MTKVPLYIPSFINMNNTRPTSYPSLRKIRELVGEVRKSGSSHDIEVCHE